MSDAETVDADDELLVAYLDGELPREQRDAVEDRLIAEESLRLRMQLLQRTWDMLDWLPSPPIDERSVKTTLQLVVADLNGGSGTSLGSVPDSSAESHAAAAQSRPEQRPHRWLKTHAKYALAIALPLCFAALVYGVARLGQLRELHSQIADFPVAIDMDAYAIGDNTQLISDLMESSRWKRVVGGSITPEIDAIIDPSSAESLYPQVDGKTMLPDRESFSSRLSTLPTSQRIVALSRWDRFNRLDEAAKTTLRKTAEQVRQGDNPEATLETMRQYVRFRQQLSDSVIAQIENETGAARSDAIDAGMEEVISSIGRVTGRGLSEEAIERIDFSVIQIVKQRLQAAQRIVEADGGAMQFFKTIEQRARRGEDPNSAYRMFALFTILRDPSWTRGEGRSFRAGPPVDEIPPISQRELETIQNMLPPKDLETLQQYVSDPWIQSMILRDWAVEATRRKLRGMAKPPSLSERYENLPDEQREILDLSSPETARKVLVEGM